MLKGVKEMILIRKIRNMTQEDVSNATGLKRVTLSAIESGRNTPSTATALILSRYFGIEFKDFFLEVEE